MSIDHYHNASIDSHTLQNLQQLEDELGVILVAVEPDPAPAHLSDDQLNRLKAAEKAMGKVLLAYKQ